MNEEQKELSPKEIYDLKKSGKEKGKRKERTREKVAEAPKKIGRYVLSIFIVR